MEFLGSVIMQILVDVTSDQLQDLIHRLMSGEDLGSIMVDGNDAATALAESFAHHGVALESLTDQQWGQLAEIMARSA